MRFCLNHLKNNKGFSLVEVIIAIAVLALLSGYVLQSFIVSQELNKKAADLDTATARCVSLIEEFKASPQTVLQAQYQESNNKVWQHSSSYTADWQNCLAGESPTFNIYSEIQMNENNTYTISVKAEKTDKDGTIKTIASLEAQKYLPEKAVE